MEPHIQPDALHRESMVALLRESLAVGFDHWIGCLALATVCDRMIDAEGGAR